MKSVFLLALALAYTLPLPALALDKIKIGSSNASSSAAIFIAKEMGYFEAEGIDAEVVIMKASSIPMTTLLAKGELDVGAGVINAGLYNAMEKGVSLKLVADKGHLDKDHDYISLVVRADLVKSGAYKNLASLKGMKLGVISADGSSQQIVLDRMLKSVGLSIKDVSLTKLTYAEINAAMKSSTIDAAIQLEPYTTMGVDTGLFQIMASGAQYHPGQISAAIIYGPRLLEKERPLGARFMKAYLLAVKEFNQAMRKKKPVHREKVISVLTKYTDAADPALWNKMGIAGLYDDGKLDIASLEHDLSWYLDHSFVTAKIAASQVVDTWFTEQARSKPGKKAKN